jgi:hypothetical protein
MMNLLLIVIPVLLVILVGLPLGGLFFYRAGLHRVPDRKVGIVYRRYGRRHPQEEFRVSLYGSIGPQAKVLRPNTRQWLMPFVFDVRYVPQTYVPDGTIGLVEATDGELRPSGRRLGKYVECDYFQDGTAFLSKGGEQGRQLVYLPGGAWYSINTELFNVVTVNTVGRNRTDGLTAADLREVTIPEGNIGVVIALDGKPPSQDPDAVGRIVEGHYSFRLPWVFLGRGGQRGVQGETLDGGTSYSINPWVARVVQVPTRDLHLEWTKKSQEEVGNFDSALDQIVVDIQGHRLRLEMSQVLRIPASAAPRLVRRFGEGELDLTRSAQGAPVVKPAPVQRFVERVLGAAVAGYFTAVVAEYSVLKFIREYDTVRLKLQDRVAEALADWNVVAGHTVLGEFVSEDGELNEQRRKLTRQDLELTQEKRRLEFLRQQRQNKEIEAEMERIAIDLKGESEVVGARKLRESEVEVLRKLRESEVEVLRKQIEVLGKHTWLMEKILGHMAKMPVPQYVSGGGGDLADQILRLMPFSNAQDMLKDLIRQGPQGPDPDQQPITADNDESISEASEAVPNEEREAERA